MKKIIARLILVLFVLSLISGMLLLGGWGLLVEMLVVFGILTLFVGVIFLMIWAINNA